MPSIDNLNIVMLKYFPQFSLRCIVCVPDRRQYAMQSQTADVISWTEACIVLLLFLVNFFFPDKFFVLREKRKTYHAETRSNWEICDFLFTVAMTQTSSRCWNFNTEWWFYSNGSLCTVTFYNTSGFVRIFIQFIQEVKEKNKREKAWQFCLLVP